MVRIECVVFVIDKLAQSSLCLWVLLREGGSCREVAGLVGHVAGVIMPSSSWFSLWRKKNDGAGDAGDAGGDGKKAAPDVAAGPPAAGAPGTGLLDGGASRYRSLMQERELKASLRESGAGADSATAATVKPVLSPKGGGGASKGAAGQTSKVRAKRLMKELRDVKQCDSVARDGAFDVDLCDENLFEWDVWLKKMDPDSKLAKDLKVLAASHGVGDIWIRMSFPDNFPFAPPFVRVLAPNIQGGFVLGGGAICMELLTPDGWSSAYTVEAIILQVMSDMVKGDARVVTRTSKPFNESEARRSYDYLVKTHKKHGWHTPAMKDG
eukprot:m.72154 g.72154  ORF g.72154 m.72154 type:complete len:324 (+) comp8764_c0_seq2:2031-3002(+)